MYFYTVIVPNSVKKDIKRRLLTINLFFNCLLVAFLREDLKIQLPLPSGLNSLLFKASVTCFISLALSLLKVPFKAI